MVRDVIIGRTETDKKRFGKEGLVYIGKHFVKMGQITSLSGRLMMDVARAHVILIAGKRGCLQGDTMVFTDKGYKPIKDFDEKEDKIFSFDKESKKFELEKAELLKYAISKESLLKIEFENGKIIILTMEHPLLAVVGNRVLSMLWVNANKLKKGDSIFAVGKSFDEINPITIKNIEKVNEVKEVYDLTVPKNHSFIANGVISHNSGKSYTLGVIAEEISSLPKEVAQNIAVLIFDTMGIFWTMNYKNEKEAGLLKEWGITPKKIPVNIFVPFGYAKRWREKGIPVTKEFALKVPEIETDDWLLTFNLSFTSPVGVVISKNVTKLCEELEEGKIKDFDIDEIIKSIRHDKEANITEKNAAINLFEGAKGWGIFAKRGKTGTKIKELVSAGKTTVLDLSCYPSVGVINVRALVIGLVTKKLFNERMAARKHEEIEAIRHGLEYLYYKEKREMPMVWLAIDEGHEFLPLHGKTAATDALIQLLREGRQPGLSLVLATQQPGQIHRDVMTQSDIVISHRVTAKPDIDSLNYIMQTYLLASIKGYLDNLPRLKGSAIILDDNSERIYPMRVHPRFTWHGGEAPTAVKIKKRD